MVAEMNERLTPVLYKEKWVYAKININSKFEDVLSNVISPFVIEVLSKGFASDFIYKRDEEERECLLLFFKTCALHCEQFVKPKLIEVLADYFEVHSMNMDVELLSKEEDLPFEDKRINFLDYYIFHYISRFHASTVSEIIMPASAKINMRLIKEAGEEWTKETAIEKALPLHIAFAHTFGMNLNEMYEFYSYIFKDLFDNIILEGGTELEEWKGNFILSLDENFLAQKEGLTGYIEYLFNLFEEGEAFEEEWINDWQKTCMLTRNEYQRLEALGLLKTPVERLTGVDEGLQIKWAHLMQYPRLINNQMVIGLEFEFTLLYYIKESLKCILDLQEVQ